MKNNSSRKFDRIKMNLLLAALDLVRIPVLKRDENTTLTNNVNTFQAKIC